MGGGTADESVWQRFAYTQSNFEGYVYIAREGKNPHCHRYLCESAVSWTYTTNHVML